MAAWSRAKEVGKGEGGRGERGKARADAFDGRLVTGCDGGCNAINWAMATAAERVFHLSTPLNPGSSSTGTRLSTHPVIVA